MILRRLSTAVRKQDWFTVAVETLIVVFGVFIGLQVNYWNAARQDKVAYLQALSQLRDELRANLDNSSAIYEEFVPSMATVQQAIIDFARLRYQRCRRKADQCGSKRCESDAGNGMAV